MYENGFHVMLESYLRHSPRFFDLRNLLVDDEMKQAVDGIDNLVFDVFQRMSVYKESKVT